MGRCRVAHRWCAWGSLQQMRRALTEAPEGFNPWPVLHGRARGAHDVGNLLRALLLGALSLQLRAVPRREPCRASRQLARIVCRQ
eukprot:4825512-Prymnesium_polylepis.1